MNLNPTLLSWDFFKYNYSCETILDILITLYLIILFDDLQVNKDW